MLEIILLIVGIVKAIRSVGFNRLSAEDFPEADPEAFAAWHEAQRRATSTFLWATWGAFFIKLCLALMAGQMQLSAEQALGFMVLILLGWFAGLFYAAVQSRRARELKEAAGIVWPSRDPHLSLVREAAGRFQTLRTEGRLPCLAPDEHGELETESDQNTKNAVYPLRVTFHVTKDNDKIRHSYAFIKADRTAGWVLEQAWRTPADGQREDLAMQPDPTVA